jgi:hypothetical protein
MWSRAPFDPLDDIKWRQKMTFDATVRRLEARKSQDLAAFVDADVDDSPSPAADADNIGWRNLHRVPVARAQLLPAVAGNSMILRMRADDQAGRGNVSATGKRGRESFRGPRSAGK